MKSTFLLLQAFALTLPAAQALSMVDYSPATDVETNAEAFFKEFYTTAENSSATTTYTDFFTSDATLKVLTNTAQGSAAILKMQQYFLPTDGSKQWNHFPNNVTISGETSTNKTYDVHATLQTSYTGGNCSTSYLQARFTITKDETAGTVNLEAHSGSIAMLDDYFVNPTVSPTDIECTK